MKCSNPECNSGVALVSQEWSWFDLAALLLEAWLQGTGRGERRARIVATAVHFNDASSTIDIEVAMGPHSALIPNSLRQRQREPSGEPSWPNGNRSMSTAGRRR